MSNIREEIWSYLSQQPIAADLQKRLEYEINEFDSNDLSGNSCLNTIYKQWKRGVKGNLNPFNSFVAYYLGITSKCPEKDSEFNFPKRRIFARPSAPDIDSDFDYEHRQEIIDYLISVYGRDCVAKIGTYQGLKMKSALTRIIKALDLANSFHKGQQAYTSDNELKAKEIKSAIPEQKGALIKVKDEHGEEHIIKTVNDAYQWCPDFRFYVDKYPDILKHANNIEGLLSIYSTHASGICLSDIPMERIAPLRTAKEGDNTLSLSTQYAYEDLELLGLIKFDILAISTLTVVAETIKMVKENCGIQIDIEKIPLDDQKTFALYQSGKLKGVFQCESYPMQKTCMDIGVDRFEDIMAAISLFRPGPMDSIPEYCARKKGQKPITYFHPSIEPYVKPILADTYGILVYQESVMRICESLGGLSKTEALIVIKGIGKKKEDIIAKGRSKFISGATSRGVPTDIAEQYWDKFITPFALYGFNLSHSCCYGFNSYLTAYLKANFTEEFLCAYMNVETRRRKYAKVASLEKECETMGIKILPRDINKCDSYYKIIKKKDPANGIAFSEIRPSLHCKGLSNLAVESIIKNRPYNSIEDLAEKTDSSVDTDAITALSEGKFLKTPLPVLLHKFETVRADMKKRKQKGDDGGSLF